MNGLTTIARAPAARAHAILRDRNHLAPLDKRRNVKKRIMGPTILTGNRRRMLVNHPLKSSRRHSYKCIVVRVWVLLIGSAIGHQFLLVILRKLNGAHSSEQ